MTCDFCGCTDDRACSGGCFWVQENFCSTCWLDIFERRAVEAGCEAVALRQIQATTESIESWFGGRGLAAQAQIFDRIWRPGDPL